jgi:hypothetical protein
LSGSRVRVIARSRAGGNLPMAANILIARYRRRRLLYNTFPL